MAAHHKKSRGITERIHISGRLILETPAHFGNGQMRGDALVDMTLLLDEAEPGRALIPGTTIAGALRNYLRERLCGYHEAEVREDKGSPIAWLFGPVRQSKTVTDQSLLVVDDALVVKDEMNWLIQGTTLRDGVRIQADTGTAADKAKFDVELLQAGTTFDLHFELALTHLHGESVLPYVATALQGLENGEIRLGARKRRGYGKCRVDEWTVSRYRFGEPADLCAWLETPSLAHRKNAARGKIAQSLDVTPAAEDRRTMFSITATFGLDRSSVLIRSGFGEADMGPDMEHLYAEDIYGIKQPVISGTTWAGVIRHRALRIVNTIAGADPRRQARGSQLVDTIFGYMPVDEDSSGRGSRVTVDETEILGGTSLYQTRVRIDRLTGGALETALFEEAPLYGKFGTTVGFGLHEREPDSAHMGLLLLVLKDLWTGDLPVGGEASVGRGRLRGIDATVVTPRDGAFALHQEQAHLGLSDSQQATLQGYVDDLWTMISNSQEADHETTHD